MELTDKDSEKAKALTPSKNTVSIENKAIPLSIIKHFLSEGERIEDGNRVQDYLKNKRGRRSKKKDNFGISGGIPSWEVCLRRNCPKLGQCFDTTKPEHPLYEVKSCDNLAMPLLTKYGKLKHKADFSPRDWSIILFALGKITSADVSDERLVYTTAMVKEIAEYSTDSKVIV